MLTRTPREGGFTLVELIVSIAILGVVMLAVTSAFFAALQADRGTDGRLDASRDVQNATTYFADDGQGAAAVTAVGSAPNCGPDPLAVVEFRGTTFDTSTFTATPAPTAPVTATYVTYVTRPAAAGQVELHRLTCSAVSTTADTDVVVARTLASAQLTSCGSAVPLTPAGCSAATSFTLRLVSADGTQDTSLVATRRIS